VDQAVRSNASRPSAKLAVTAPQMAPFQGWF
jgi:hypothetical protein